MVAIVCKMKKGGTTSLISLDATNPQKVIEVVNEMPTGDDMIFQACNSEYALKISFNAKDVAQLMYIILKNYPGGIGDLEFNDWSDVVDFCLTNDLVKLKTLN